MAVVGQLYFLLRHINEILKRCALWSRHTKMPQTLFTPTGDDVIGKFKGMTNATVVYTLVANRVHSNTFSIAEIVLYTKVV
jgi:hypothetical protein